MNEGNEMKEASAVGVMDLTTELPGENFQLGLFENDSAYGEKLDAMTEAVTRVGTLKPNTIKDYHQKISFFISKCGGSFPCTPAEFLRYASHLVNQGWKADTIRHYLDAVQFGHKERGLPSPADNKNEPSIVQLKALMKVVRTKQAAYTKRAKPIRPEMLTQMMSVESKGGLIGMRNAALFAITWGSAMRISETLALTLDDILWDDRGLTITIRRSKTDQEGEGQQTFIPSGEFDHLGLCKVIQRWLDKIPWKSGYIFPRINEHHPNPYPDHNPIDNVMKRGLTRAAAHKIIKQTVEQIGVDPDGYSPHSLRAGYATTLAEAGAPVLEIQQQTRHKTLSTLGIYIREGDMYKKTPMRFLSEALRTVSAS